MTANKTPVLMSEPTPEFQAECKAHYEDVQRRMGALAGSLGIPDDRNRARRAGGKRHRLLAINHVSGRYLIFRGHSWCRLSESNGRPSAYKAGALPTELSRRELWRDSRSAT